MRVVTAHIQKFGSVTVAAYDFLADGDELPLHTHSTADNHITIVAVGTVLAFGDAGERVLRSGEIIDWPVGEQHGFRFLARPARIYNILKEVQP